MAKGNQEEFQLRCEASLVGEYTQTARETHRTIGLGSVRDPTSPGSPFRASREGRRVRGVHDFTGAHRPVALPARSELSLVVLAVSAFAIPPFRDYLPTRPGNACLLPRIDGHYADV